MNFVFKNCNNLKKSSRFNEQLDLIDGLVSLDYYNVLNQNYSCFLEKKDES